MAVLLSSRNAARFGADVCSDSWAGLHGAAGSESRRHARAHRTGESVSDRASVKIERRRVKRAERAAWRREVA